MSYLKASAVGLGCSALIVGFYLWQREPAASAPPRPRAAATPAVVPNAVAVATAAPSAAPKPVSVRSALAHAFPGTPPPRALLERLAAGDVGGVARELAASDESAAAVHLFDLAALCASEGHAPAEGGSAEERAALEASAAAPAARVTLERLIETRHRWQARFAAGCASAPLDAATIHRRLGAAAVRGDAASFERLASQDAQPLARLMSAALLGNPRAQFRLGLDEMPAQPAQGRSWLEVAAKTDADAAAYYALCLLGGCAAPADPAAARTELESAARMGSLYALGLLASAGGADGPHRWSRADAIVTPVAPHDVDGLGLDSAAGYAWASLAAALASSGCFGFEFGATAEALEARPRLERSLRTVELEVARTAAGELEASSGAALRHALDCD